MPGIWGTWGSTALIRDLIKLFFWGPAAYSLLIIMIVIMMTKIPNASKCFYHSTKSIYNNHLCPRPYQQAIPRGKHKWSQRPISSLARPLRSTRCTQSVQNWFFIFQLLFVTWYQLLQNHQVDKNVIVFFSIKNYLIPYITNVPTIRTGIGVLQIRRIQSETLVIWLQFRSRNYCLKLIWMLRPSEYLCWHCPNNYTRK